MDNRLGQGRGRIRRLRVRRRPDSVTDNNDSNGRRYNNNEYYCSQFARLSQSLAATLREDAIVASVSPFQGNNIGNIKYDRDSQQLGQRFWSIQESETNNENETRNIISSLLHSKSSRAGLSVEFLPLLITFPSSLSTSSSPQEVYVSYNGGDIIATGSEVNNQKNGLDGANSDDVYSDNDLDGEIELPSSILPANINFVTVEALSAIRDATVLNVEPLTYEDWELLQAKAEFLESGGLLQQVTVVYADQIIPLWVGKQDVAKVRVLRDNFVQQPEALRKSNHSYDTKNDNKRSKHTITNTNLLWPSDDTSTKNIDDQGNNEFEEKSAARSHNRSGIFPWNCLRLVADTKVSVKPIPYNGDKISFSPPFRVMPTWEDYSIPMHQLSQFIQNNAKIQKPTEKLPMVQTIPGTALINPNNLHYIPGWTTSSDTNGDHDANAANLEQGRLAIVWDANDRLSTGGKNVVRIMASEKVPGNHVALHPLTRIKLKVTPFFDHACFKLLTQMEIRTHGPDYLSQLVNNPNDTKPVKLALQKVQLSGAILQTPKSTTIATDAFPLYRYPDGQNWTAFVMPQSLLLSSKRKSVNDKNKNDNKNKDNNSPSQILTDPNVPQKKMIVPIASFSDIPVQVGSIFILPWKITKDDDFDHYHGWREKHKQEQQKQQQLSHCIYRLILKEETVTTSEERNSFAGAAEPRQERTHNDRIYSNSVEWHNQGGPIFIFAKDLPELLPSLSIADCDHNAYNSYDPSKAITKISDPFNNNNDNNNNQSFITIAKRSDTDLEDDYCMVSHSTPHLVNLLPSTSIMPTEYLLDLLVSSSSAHRITKTTGVSAAESKAHNNTTSTDTDYDAIIYGPPGSGKTHTALVVAAIARLLNNRSTLYLDCNQLKSASTSLRMKDILMELKKLFDEAVKGSPSLIVLDNLDDLAPNYQFDNDTDNSNGSSQQHSNINPIAMDQSKLIADVLRHFMETASTQACAGPESCATSISIIMTCQDPSLIASSILTGSSRLFVRRIHVPVLNPYHQEALLWRMIHKNTSHEYDDSSTFLNNEFEYDLGERSTSCNNDTIDGSGSGDRSRPPPKKSRQRRCPLPLSNEIRRQIEGFRPRDLSQVASRVRQEQMRSAATLTASLASRSQSSPYLEQQPELTHTPKLTLTGNKMQRTLLYRESIEAAICDFVPLCRLSLLSSSSNTDTSNNEGHNTATRKESGPDWHKDIGGLFRTKAELTATILRPAKYRRVYEKAAKASPSNRLPRGVLLFGPPGCGKSYIVPALAKECGDAFSLITCRGPELLDKYIGASEAKVRELFTLAMEASPSILFFDEIDSLAPKRGSDHTGVADRIVNQLLTLLDGVEDTSSGGDSSSSLVYVVAATSRPDVVDPALLRPGRLEKHVYITYPESEAEWTDMILKIASRFVVGADNNGTNSSIVIHPSVIEYISTGKLVEDASSALASCGDNDMNKLKKSSLSSFFCPHLFQLSAADIKGAFDTARLSAIHELLHQLENDNSSHIGDLKENEKMLPIANSVASTSTTKTSRPRKKQSTVCIRLDHIQKALERTRPSLSKHDHAMLLDSYRPFVHQKDKNSTSTSSNLSKPLRTALK